MCGEFVSIAMISLEEMFKFENIIVASINKASQSMAAVENAFNELINKGVNDMLGAVNGVIKQANPATIDMLTNFNELVMLTIDICKPKKIVLTVTVAEKATKVSKKRGKTQPKTDAKKPKNTRALLDNGSQVNLVPPNNYSSIRRNA